MPGVGTPSQDPQRLKRFGCRQRQRVPSRQSLRLRLVVLPGMIMICLLRSSSPWQANAPQQTDRLKREN